VLLPNKSARETSEYAANPDIAIIANTESVHAVRENKLRLTGINFWQDEPATVDTVTSSGAASVMLKEFPAEHRLDVAVSDPTLENAGVIELEIARPAAGTISNDPQITVSRLSPTLKLAIDVKGSLGQTFNASFRLLE